MQGGVSCFRWTEVKCLRTIGSLPSLCTSARIQNGRSKTNTREYRRRRWRLQSVTALTPPLSSLSSIMLRQWEETRAIAAQMLESGDHSLLVDFDSHLDDITKDWTNQRLNSKIEELASPANGSL